MTVRPELLTLVLVCLQDGHALSVPALNCTKMSLAGGNMTTRPSKSLTSDAVMDHRHLDIHMSGDTPSNTEGGFALIRNTSSFESRAGPPVRPQHIFSVGHQHRNDDLGRYPIKESHIMSELQRRPAFYIPPLQKHLDKTPSNSHALQVKRPDRPYQFAGQNSFYRQPGLNERRQEVGLHQIVPRIYPFKLGPDKAKPILDMHSHAHEMSVAKPPQVMPSNVHETSEPTPSLIAMSHSGKLTHDYKDTNPYPDTGSYKAHNYHYDHSYDSYDYVHHTELTEKITTPSPPVPVTEKAVSGHYRIGFKLYYIPLYAGISFVFYVLTLILKSISRHKGQVPYNFLTSPPARMLREDLAHRVIRALETSRQRYNACSK